MNMNEFMKVEITDVRMEFIRCKKRCSSKKVERTTEDQLFHSYDYHKLPPYQILGGKTVKTIQIDPQTTEI